MKQTVIMPGYMGKPWEVTGDVVSGLILHKMGKSWTVSHVATGNRVGKGWAYLKEAKEARVKMMEILPDWSADSVESLAKSAGMDARAFTDMIRAAVY